MFDRFFAGALVFCGSWLGIAIAAFASFFVSGWHNTITVYLAVLAVLWTVLRLEALLGFVIGHLLGQIPSVNRVIDRADTHSRNWLLVGVCAGFAISVIWAPTEILKLLGVLRR
jgi:hypothetical protein